MERNKKRELAKKAAAKPIHLFLNFLYNQMPMIEEKSSVSELLPPLTTLAGCLKWGLLG
ncbi:hypothetical protein J2S74_003197 [Evansella vedderi]|uniref:Uncharacterized protein n=1 Tax=Evansella vedderi TaxID=38282 RepID=A0ABT9ZXY0_9BACI|nr:hypothetical protein [Evansella vedderi]MDQ0255815.1 hypothetical protein [Evansella vedderi]